MGKNISNVILLNKGITSNENLIVVKTKTTNINILLNRVRLDKKKELRKKITISILLVSTISVVSFFIIL